MPFIEAILKHKSLSIVGMAKNTGKTVCLNYIIKRLHELDKKIALTSIGIDGEKTDQVTHTEKPEIELAEGSIFVTSEKHYKQRELTAEILNLSERQTSLGRLVTAKVINTGKVILSGPTSTVWLSGLLSDLQKYEIDIALVDGALSRKSLGAPSVTQSMILTTGAAVSKNIPKLVQQTKYTVSLINLEVYKTNLSHRLLAVEKGLWAIDEKNREVHDLKIPSTFLLEKFKDNLFQYGNIIYASGVVSDKILHFLSVQKNLSEIVLVVKDFTKIFASQQAYNMYISKGGNLKVLLKTKLIALCINPVSPEGYVLDTKKLKNALTKEISLPVYDVKDL